MQTGETDRDARHGEQQRQSGRERRAERDEQQDHGGQTGEQLRLVQCLFVGVVEVAPHRPLAGHFRDRVTGEVERSHVADHEAGRLGELGVVGRLQLHRHEHGEAVGGDEAGVGRHGHRVGHAADTFGVGEGSDDRLHGCRVVDDRSGLANDDHGRLGADLREVAAQFVADLLGDGALRFPAGAGQRAGERDGQGCRGERDHQPRQHQRTAAAGREAAETGEQVLLLGAVERCLIGTGRSVSSDMLTPYRIPPGVSNPEVSDELRPAAARSGRPCRRRRRRAARRTSAAAISSRGCSPAGCR